MKRNSIIQIRAVAPEDIPSITDIYNYYVNNTIVTFDDKPVSIETMKHKRDQITRSYPWFVLEENEMLVGYAYGSLFRAKPAYRFTVETTIYLHTSTTGKGYGTQLYKHLLTDLKERGYRTAIGVLGLPNPASVKLHEKLGFEQVGQLKHVGWKFDRWIDTGYWELDLQNV